MRVIKVVRQKLLFYYRIHDNSTGTIYTGGADGRLFAIRNRSLTLIGRTGISHSQCGTFEYEPACGRPKGMKVGPDGYLYIVDAYKGLLKMDLKDYKIETLIESQKGINRPVYDKKPSNKFAYAVRKVSDQPAYACFFDHMIYHSTTGIIIFSFCWRLWMKEELPSLRRIFQICVYVCVAMRVSVAELRSSVVWNVDS